MRFELYGPKREPLTREERQRLARQVRFTLSRFGERVSLVRLRVSAPRSPAGGATECCITVSLRPGGTIRVRREAADLPSAVSRAAESAGRRVQRALESEQLDAPRR